MLNWDERQFKVTQCLQHSLTFLLICKFKGDQIKKKKKYDHTIQQKQC